MGKITYNIIEFFNKSAVFTTRDIKLFVKNKNYSYLLISNLIKKGKIKKIVKGYYSFYDDPTLSVFCFRPAYIGLHDALSFHNLWEQETNVVIITTRKVRIGVRKVFGNNVIIHRIKLEYFFGFDYLPYDKFFVPVSDIEKTFIDLFYFRFNLDKKVIKEIKRFLDEKKLKRYLRVYPEFIRKKIAYI